MRWVLSGVATVAVVYLLAGRWDLPWMWAMAGVGLLAVLPLTLTIDPELARERRRPGPGGRDHLSRWLIAVFVGAAMVIACLDVGRFHWSDGVPATVHAAGLALVGLGYALVSWAVMVNRFFSSVVRVQTDRGHQIITTGPYRYLRHPGYLGMLMGYPTPALAIGSWWALVPSAAAVLIVLRRLRIEDAYLRANLAGYPEYAARVRYRLLPGLW